MLIKMQIEPTVLLKQSLEYINEIEQKASPMVLGSTCDCVWGPVPGRKDQTHVSQSYVCKKFDKKSSVTSMKVI